MKSREGKIYAIKLVCYDINYYLAPSLHLYMNQPDESPSINKVGNKVGNAIGNEMGERF